jgi:putative transcriptional regulator
MAARRLAPAAENLGRGKIGGHLGDPPSRGKGKRGRGEEETDDGHAATLPATVGKGNHKAAKSRDRVETQVCRTARAVLSLKPAGPWDTDMDLTSNLLIAMPGMGDPRFDRSVIFLCAHSADGAMGLIVNKPAPDLRFRDLMEQLGIAAGPRSIRLPIHVGGPVEHGRGFVLHSADYGAPGATLGVDDRFGMTATLQILEDIASGAGPALGAPRARLRRLGPGAARGRDPAQRLAHLPRLRGTRLRHAGRREVGGCAGRDRRRRPAPVVLGRPGLTLPLHLAPNTQTGAEPPSPTLRQSAGRGAAARASRSLIARPRPVSGTGATAMRPPAGVERAEVVEEVRRRLGQVARGRQVEIARDPSEAEQHLARPASAAFSRSAASGA